MSQPEAPVPTRHPRSPSVQRWNKRVAAAAVAVALLLLVMAGYIRYETDHDLPNPSWGILNGDYSYTFDDGPPAVGLVDIRPDELVSGFFHDYIRVAGTYPCDISLTKTGRCTRYRPVSGVQIGPTRMVADHFLPFSQAHDVSAYVPYRIDYADGQNIQGVLDLIAERSQPYFTTRIHATCWYFREALTFYPAIVSPMPPGLAYHIGYELTDRCSGYD